jgi:hypothetical protein
VTVRPALMLLWAPASLAESGPSAFSRHPPKAVVRSERPCKPRASIGLRDFTALSRQEGRWGLYVGQTSRDADGRFDQHKGTRRAVQ